MVAIAARFEVHCVASALPGVRRAADVAFAVPSDGGLLAAIIDPCGQGTHAVEAGVRAAELVRRAAGKGLGTTLARVHDGLLGTLGVSVALAQIGGDQVEFAGVGRGYGALVQATGVEVLIGSQGTVGVGLPRSPLINRYAWSAGDVLILAADGLVDAWDLTGAAAIRGLSMPRLVERLAGSGSRLPEDASVVIVRELGPG